MSGNHFLWHLLNENFYVVAWWHLFEKVNLRPWPFKYISVKRDKLEQGSLHKETTPTAD